LSGSNRLLKLASEIESRAASIEQDVARGAVPDWSAYREKVGELKGLRRAAEMVRELNDKLFKEEQDD